MLPLAPLALGVSVFAVVAIAFVAIRQEIRMRKLFRGTKAHDLEALIGSIISRTDKHDKIQKGIIAHLDTVEARLSKRVLSPTTVRFNPFQESGGNQSFATALVDDHGDGVIISSLYARERISIFAKPVAGGISSFELTREENEVLKASLAKKS